MWEGVYMKELIQEEARQLMKRIADSWKGHHPWGGARDILVLSFDQPFDPSFLTGLLMQELGLNVLSLRQGEPGRFPWSCCSGSFDQSSALHLA